MLDGEISLGLLVPAMAILGLIAGTLGGMLGVGGSVIMIPALTVLITPNQHVYQAAAMIANVAVTVPAARRHLRAGAVVPQAFRWMLPATLVFILVGVFLSALPVFAGNTGEMWLRRLFALFLVWVIVQNVQKLLRKQPENELSQWKVTPGRSLGVGVVMGTMAGLLGIGGGAVSVPMQQRILHIPLRNCIGTSAAVICLTAGFGALYKNWTLIQRDDQYQSLQTSLILAIAMAPTCVVGGHFGGHLTHRLPVKQVRVIFIGLMVLGAVRMAEFP